MSEEPVITTIPCAYCAADAEVVNGRPVLEIDGNAACSDACLEALREKRDAPSERK